MKKEKVQGKENKQKLKVNKQKVIGEKEKVEQKVEEKDRELKGLEEKSKKIKKVNRFAIEKKQEKEVENESERGVIFISHLPSGFVEEGLYQYFGQFGKVTRVKLARSRKTARSKGYAWVQFQYKEIAQMAAKAIHGYIMHSKQIKAIYLDAQQLLTYKNPFLFKKTLKKYKFVDWQQKFIDKRNSPKTPEQIKQDLEKLLKKEEQKRQQIKDLGINYTFSGFQQLLQQKNKK